MFEILPRPKQKCVYGVDGLIHTHIHTLKVRKASCRKNLRSSFTKTYLSCFGFCVINIISVCYHRNVNIVVWVSFVYFSSQISYRLIYYSQFTWIFSLIQSDTTQATRVDAVFSLITLVYFTWRNVKYSRYWYEHPNIYAFIPFNID